MAASPNPNFVTGTATATIGGVQIPTENIRPAQGLLGAVTLVAGTAAVTLAAPGSGSFTLPVGVPISLVLGGTKLTATSGGTGTISWAYATGG